MNLRCFLYAIWIGIFLMTTSECKNHFEDDVERAEEFLSGPISFFLF